jgi:hypothetical protein
MAAILHAPLRNVTKLTSQTGQPCRNASEWIARYCRLRVIRFDTFLHDLDVEGLKRGYTTNNTYRLNELLPGPQVIILTFSPI